MPDVKVLYMTLVTCTGAAALSVAQNQLLQSDNLFNLLIRITNSAQSGETIDDVVSIQLMVIVICRYCHYCSACQERRTGHNGKSYLDPFVLYYYVLLIL